MDPQMVTQIAVGAGIVFGGGVVLAPFVSHGVNVIKRMMGRSTRRRVVLPLAGLLIGWCATYLLLLLLRLEWSAETVALAILTGYWASAAADQQNAKAKEASKSEDGRG